MDVQWKNSQNLTVSSWNLHNSDAVGRFVDEVKYRLMAPIPPRWPDGIRNPPCLRGGECHMDKALEPN